MQLKSLLAQVLRDNRGATAVEYGLILALVVLVVITGIQGVANENTRTWKDVVTRMQQVLH